MSGSKASVKLLGFSLFALGLAACQAIAGIEERKLEAQAPVPVDSDQCISYCDSVMAACQDDFAVYTSKELCLGVCAKLDAGDRTEPIGNTVACRAKQAEVAEREPEEHCKSAGPGGNGVCGTDCEAYCQLFPQVCPDDVEYDKKACLKACSGLTDQDSFSAMADHGGDSIECRLVHVSSATLLPKDHCQHAPIPPALPWCTGAADASPTCAEYCKIEMVACDGDLQQYDTEDQCVAACAAFDLGRNDDQVGNTIGCRRYHAFSSTLLPTTHCYHSGPTGDGHCGDHGKVSDGHTGNCESYCSLLAAACPDEFATLGSPEKCMKSCVDLPEAAPDSKYTLAGAAKSKGLDCRILNAVRAFDDKATCAAALGGDPCN